MLLPILTLAPSVARTTSGNGDWLDLLALAAAVNGSRALRVQIEVTAVSGTTPTLNVFLEDCLDGNPANANSFGATSANITAAGRTIITCGPRGDAYPTNFAWPFNPSRVRARWVITGTTPSFTFSVKGVLI